MKQFVWGFAIGVVVVSLLWEVAKLWFFVAVLLACIRGGCPSL